MFDDHPALDRFVDQAGRLYSPPTVAVEILRLTSQPKVDVAALKQCLLRDPALVGKILRVVNSSLFGLSREVVELGQALALLGTKSVRLLVLGFSLPDELFLGLAGDILERYWHHTMVKAAAAREISESFYRMPGEEPFIAGLLQDIGVLVLLQQLGEPYIRFLDRAFQQDVDVESAETVALGFEHEQLSARLLKSWGLRESLVTAIAVGRSVERIDQLPAGHRTLPQILHLANLVADVLTERRPASLAQLQQVAREYRQVTQLQISALITTLQTRVGQLAEVLSLEMPKGVDYQDIFADAHRQLASAAEDAAVELAGRKQRQRDGADWLEEQVWSASAALSDAAKRFLAYPTAAGQPTASAAPVPISNSIASAHSAATATLQKPAAVQAPKNNALTQQVQSAIAACRKAREPLSLVLVNLDRAGDIDQNLAASNSRRLAQLVGLLCGRIEHSGIVQLETGSGTFALLLSNCDRPVAAEIGHRLLCEVRRLCEKHPDLAKARLSVSIGVSTAAMPAKNFSAESLIQSAERCLNAAQLSGGNSVKTIDVL